MILAMELHLNVSCQGLKAPMLILFASYFKEHVTYHTQNLQLALGQTASSLICFPLAVDTKPVRPHSSSQ